MKIPIKHLFVLLFACILTKIHAGYHWEEKDDFDGKVSAAYFQTNEEKMSGGFWMYLDDYNPKSKQITLNIMGPLGVDCENRGLEIKTYDGTIHKVSAGEARIQNCYATIPIGWTKNRFTVRVPMRGKPSLIGTMNTESLKPERYKKLAD